jgi:hypothetical protein
MADKYIVSRNGTKRIRQTTVGWKFLVKWTNGGRQWIPLKILKESNPVQVAEYLVAQNIADEPAFAWWIHYVLRKHDIIVLKFNAQIWQRTHKYGIEMPAPGKNTIANTIELDRWNGNTFWMNSLGKEIGNLIVAFKIKNPGEKSPLGWFKTTGHIVWDVKMDSMQKARWVKDGHKTPDPTTSSYAGVVSRESIHIALT